MISIKEDTVLRKGRVRPNRGITKGFSFLPNEVQERFKEAKKLVKELAIEDDKVSVYVYGSYHWGWYDSESDIDVIIEKQPVYFNPQEFAEYFSEKKGFECQINMMKKESIIKHKLIEIK